MDALLLLLLDSRAPAGGHSHSGGMEPAVDAGLVRDVRDVEDFCRGRLRTAGRVAADAAGFACALSLSAATRGELAGMIPANSPRVATADALAELDAELDARMPSEAVRASSRALGRGLLRLARSMLPDFDVPGVNGPGLDGAGGIAAPHHPVVLGAAVAAAGGTPLLAARAAALATVNAPASAAVRLLGLDPYAVQGALARLAAEIDTEFAAGSASGSWAPPLTAADLAADCAPVLDLLADIHLTAEVRLFAS